MGRISHVAALPADLVTLALAHEGTKAYSNTFELVHRREADRPNAVWQADHTPLDILLIRPDGAVAKPWLTTVMYDYSRAIAGYFLSFKNRPRCTLPSRYVRRFGARKIRAGSYAASPMFYTPTMGAT